MSKVPEKYKPATLPTTRWDAEVMATDREKWAAELRAIDRPGTAHEFELTALLLRAYAERI